MEKTASTRHVSARPSRPLHQVPSQPLGMAGEAPAVQSVGVSPAIAAVGANGSLASRTYVDGKFLALGGRRLRVQGVTYGPFAPNGEGLPFPALAQARDDFRLMRAAGINAFRTYHVPPDELLRLAEERGLSVFVDVPWGKHLCFLESAEARREAREAVRQAAQRGREHSCVLAYSIGNEIPTEIVRWHGSRQIERFLAELADVVKQTDPQGLVTYANYPPTEYLELPFLDIATFNVYLHDRDAHFRYLFRLQNLVGDKPLLLGELGMDTLRHGETQQADFLSGHLTTSLLMGLAGAFVFSWTDDWCTGGHRIEDWAFGITRADRSPKTAYHELRRTFASRPVDWMEEVPRVSVIVCSYNGGRTLKQCLHSLLALDYPDYEVILVDDGSIDDTREIAAHFPAVHAIHQPNQGLSEARNVGLRAATGDVIAYTDSDCFADADWLTHLVYQLRRSGAAAVGGPNLSPEDGWLAACVAASPGQPTHVLESDQVAEHIPGCNMAFRREALLAINGFDPQYRKAGDDVDICWRLQQAGFWITFAPSAFVWHHRRQTPRAYLRQQAGYGEAEALLRFQHPDRFNGRGEGKWRGMLYGASLRGLRLGGALIYRGTFGCGLFQCLYQPSPAHWAMLPSTLEWHFAVALIALTGLLWPPGWAVACVMLVLSLLVAVLQAAQARLAPKYAALSTRALIAALCYAQPLVRSWRRYRTRLFAPRGRAAEGPTGEHPPRLPLGGQLTVSYWSEDGYERIHLLREIIANLGGRGWAKVLDSGWSDWDLQVYRRAWTVVQVCTVQEDHGGGKRLIRARFRLRPRTSARLAVAAGLAAAGVLACAHVVLGIGAGGAVLAASLGAWWHGAVRAAHVIGVFNRTAKTSGLSAVETSR